MKNLHIIEFHNMENNIIQLRSYRYSHIRIEKDFKDDCFTAYDHVKKYLESKGLNIIGHCSKWDGDCFISDTDKDII